MLLEEFDGSATWRQMPLLPAERLLATPRDGFVRSRGCLTVFLVETTMALVEDNAVFASRQFDMGNSGKVDSLGIDTA